MSYELIHLSTRISRKFSRQFFSKALELARLYGWKPSGTLPPIKFDYYKPIAEWHGTYLTNDGQIIKAEDTYALMAALEKSLGDIPDAIEIDWNPKSWIEDDLPEWLSPEEKEIIEDELQNGLLDILGMSPLEYFAGGEKQQLIHFIKFCRLGSFVIL